MKIFFDVSGGDYPFEAIKGVLLALNNIKDLTAIIAGKEDFINKSLKQLSQQKQFANYDKDRLVIINCTEEITNDDKPTDAIRTKKDSSMVKGFDLLKNDPEVIAFVSAGSTGAILTGGFMKIGRIRGVSWPATCPILPTEAGTPVLLMDSGANMDCKPINLLHFAIMASKYYEVMFDKKEPRIALASVGVEEEKGNELVKQTLPLIKQLPINYVGNMESRDLLSGNYDAVITDGFAGNVMLKSTEGSVAIIIKMIKNALKNGSLCAKIGGLLIKKTLKNMLKSFDYTNYGGAPLLGIKKIVIKAHGDSKAKSFLKCAEQAIKLYSSGCYEAIENEVAKINLEIQE